MKITTTQPKPKTGTFNVFSLGAISFTWAHFLGLISLWFIPLTIALYFVGYGSEITSDNFNRK